MVGLGTLFIFLTVYGWFRRDKLLESPKYLKIMLYSIPRGLLWAVFFMTDGFDFGVGTLYPYLGKTEDDKRAMINSIGPFWDGNEVWLITTGGVTFAAFPKISDVDIQAF